MNLTDALAALSSVSAHITPTADGFGIHDGNGVITLIPARTYNALQKRGYVAKAMPAPVSSVPTPEDDNVLKLYYVHKGTAHASPSDFKGGMAQFRDYVRSLHKGNLSQIKFCFATNVKQALIRTR